MLDHETDKGKFLLGDTVHLLQSKSMAQYKGKVNLILTSPPFPLNKKKKYGNLQGEEYLTWFKSLAPLFSEYLSEKGSIVIEIGNAWEHKRPIQSLLHLEALLAFTKHPKAGLSLCQEVICYNPARLPSPAQWVTVDRIRLIDSYTHVWWLSKNDFPAANNSKVLRPYSKSMKRLLARQKYNPGKRPSEHKVSERGFLKDNGGSIMPNFIQLEAFENQEDHRLPQNILSFSNTSSNDSFSKACRTRGITPHPARMSARMVAFFLEFLTEPGDLVLDPFAGSNTTGFVAESLNRNWIGIEAKGEYAEQARLRFDLLD